MLLGEHRMIGVLQGDHFLKSMEIGFLQMIGPGWEGGGQGMVFGWFHALKPSQKPRQNQSKHTRELVLGAADRYYKTVKTHCVSGGFQPSAVLSRKAS